MKKILPIVLPVALLVIVAGVAWFGVFANNASTAKQGAELVQLIEKSEDLKTYYNALDSYDEMISREPDNIDWYIRRAVAYYEMEEYSAYESACKQMIQVFPDNREGYYRLIKYYDDNQAVKKLVSAYLGMPSAIQSDAEIKALYDPYEFTWNYVSSSYQSVSDIYNGYGLVCKNGYYGYVNGDGSLVLECRYDDAKAILENKAAVKENDEWFIVNTKGYRIAASHDKITELYSPSCGIAAAQVDGKWGFYDETLTLSALFEFEQVTSIYNGVGAVKKDGKWALINSNLDYVTEFIFEDVAVDSSTVCSRCGVVFAKQDGKWALYSADGNRIGSETFDKVKTFRGELAAVKQGSKWGYVDQSGVVKISCQFKDAASFENGGLGAAKTDAGWCFINTEGDVVAQTEFDAIGVVMENGLVRASTTKSERYIQFLKLSF